MKAAALDPRKVPVLPFALAVIVGVVTALYSDFRSGTLLVACAGLFLLSGAALWAFGTRLVALLPLLLFFAALGAYRATDNLGREIRSRVATLAEQDSVVAIIGAVAVSPDVSEGNSAVIVQSVSLVADSQTVACGSMRARIFGSSTELADLQYGDLLYARGRLVAAAERQTGVGSMITLVSQRDVASLYADTASYVVQHVSGFSLRRMVDRLRGFITGTYDRRLSPDGAALCKALVLGNRSDFSAAFSDRLRLTGLSHVFALSGMNVGFLMATVWVLLSVLFVPRGVRLGVLFGIVLLYMELGREAPSLVRATLMAAIYITGAVLHRRPSPVNSVACAAFVETLWRPLDIVDAGFALSYLAVLGLIGGYEYIHEKLAAAARLTRRKSTLRALIELLSASAGAQIGTLPMTGFLFGRIPVLGVLGNIAAVPAFGAMLLLAVALLIIEAVVPALSPWFAGSLNGAAYLMGSLVSFTASLPLASLSVPLFSPWIAVLLYAATAGLLLGFAISHRVWIGASLLLAGNVIVWAAVFAKPDPLCRLSFLSVGNGDATVISTPSGGQILVDAGPAFGDWSAADRILPFLAEQGIRHLDALILTHPDNDHIGGAAKIIESMPVNHVYINGDVSPSQTRVRLDVAESAKGIHEQRLTAGNMVRLSDQVSVMVLSPDSAVRPMMATENQRSLVLRLKCSHSTALLPADVDSAMECALQAWGAELDVDLLKIAHHGSKASTTLAFLKQTTPTEGIISVGRHNLYGHPHLSVISRLESLKIPIHMTSREGTVTYASDGHKWTREESRAARLTRLWRLPHG
ncbi:MAG TPA: DNA internalization-related competence protein ComEC/Rec2 [bacterium]|jgi:competence protein ComEC